MTRTRLLLKCSALFLTTLPLRVQQTSDHNSLFQVYVGHGEERYIFGAFLCINKLSFSQVDPISRLVFTFALLLCFVLHPAVYACDVLGDVASTVLCLALDETGCCRSSGRYATQITPTSSPALPWRL